MAFTDFPFRDTLPSFIGHADVLKYLEDYADHFKLLRHIKFWTVVESVTPIKKEESDREKWIVKVKNVLDKSRPVESDVFDAVIVCNGHYSVPYTPPIPGLEEFKGDFIHSHHYRRPDGYKDKIVAMIGAGNSGTDIAVDLASFAKKVFLCHWNAPMTTKLPDNVEQIQTVKAIKRDKMVEFADGREEEVDAIIACTGYDYSFPFLSPECQLTIHNKHIKQLYLHLMHIVYPTMSFIGITYKVCPFPQFAAQVRLVLAVLEGSFVLPSRQEMEEEERITFEKLLESGKHERFYHFLDDGKQWAYNTQLANMGGFEDLNPCVEDLYNKVSLQRKINAMNYKNMRYRLTDDWWEQVSDAK
ncbi:putative flavin-containing monooxygenase FMO GS-OX-like 4-like [Apostichopus japonicus]|uniref:Flavin-containing monooxygenase n=1 Tax=Stichopus japonicus TaxID=307972 RepID=A0A2G8KV01_STIJA|nr:putative flavin-containing monooxygenase FMO GS-OX-like 4-like [Apostichopus japonicus]